MSADTATTVRVAYQFELTVEAPSSDDASYFACGGTAVLGDWDADRAVKLAPVAGSAGLYLGRSATHTVRLSGDDVGSEALEYKFMYRIGDSAPVWIPGDNLRIAGPALEDAHATTVAEVDGTARSSPRAAVCLRRTAHTWVVTRDDGTGVVLHDPYLEPFSGALRHRYGVYQRMKASIDSMGGLDKFTRGYDFYGFTRVEAGDGHRPGIMYREWAPGARAASVVGDFNGWDASRNPCKRNEFGVFEAFLEDSEDGKPQIPHDSFVKVSLVLESGERVLRVPAWIKYAKLDHKAASYCGVYWQPPDAYTWKTERLGGLQRRPRKQDSDVDGSHAGESAGSGSGAGAGAGAGATAARGASHVPERASAHASSSKPGAASGAAEASDPYAGLKVYEAHVGMASADEKIASYTEFKNNVLPRIKTLGYNCVQLMAIMEHSYYASFGYHVTNFFAVSSRFGTPDELKALIDAAHELGIAVVCDLVHAHASKNVDDGINMFDGTGYQYFHEGGRGTHELWDSRLFNYGKVEVQRFLLSNLRWFIDEYRFDGYRFDGVTSMLYKHHGIGTGFSGGYHEYFGESVDEEAVAYLMLANDILHGGIPLTRHRPCISIAEDVSGMPALCRPVAEGGVGFDYRLGMAVPDMWIKMLKEQRDEEWNMGHVAHTLLNRRFGEKTVAYCESHDQALVGDKTIAFWLMDKEMYDNMTVLAPLTNVLDRGIALHKMIRLITLALGGEGYLTFMGNEFGHPEWIDFPRAGNGDSFKHCRRLWHLAGDGLLRYAHLNAFEVAMQSLAEECDVLRHSESYVSLKHEGDKLIVFEKAGLVFVFNFHPTKSFTDYRIGVNVPGCYEVKLSSDHPKFGGHDRVAESTEYFTANIGHCNRKASMQIYSPSRTALVFGIKAAQ